MSSENRLSEMISLCREQLFTAVVADTLDMLGYHHQVLTPGITPLDPSRILCGLARVGLYMPIYHDDETTKVYEHEIALVDSLRTNDVPVLVCHGNKKISPWGELLSERSSYLGAAGCLTDGCVRDSRMIREMGFPVYCAGTNPSDTKYRGKLMMWDVPGEIAGVRVESGDLVFGDQDGTVIVPSAVIAETIEKSFEKVTAENTVRDEIRRGDKLVDIFGRHEVL
ncbi:RraA family protein [Devosia rhodophyticola]|uniref:Putative 4-hydroxy-4-methyl-2-oxoglutarate aldolase n=1 Tax=Devosia rhodophyticola TaxID=3026423 RepID=A0ABY7YYV9_9HYPH|nr:RraA family protein [Devosia rhodophyticola]WDR06205.1 RraA family protein [Devosia rhodophyticola]